MDIEDQKVTIIRREQHEDLPELVWATQEYEGSLVLRVDAETSDMRKHCSASVDSPFEVTLLDDRDFREQYMHPMVRALFAHFVDAENASELARRLYLQ